MSLIPNSQLGRVINDKSGTIISTGSGSKTISTIIDSLNLAKDFSFPNSSDKTFTEGSYALWNLGNGKYKINWEFSTKEPVIGGNKDSVYIYDGEQFILLDSASNEYLIDIQYEKLVMLVLDEKDRKATTQVKITDILLVGNINNNSDDSVNVGNNEEINFRLGGDITAYHKIITLRENKQFNLGIDNLVTIKFTQNNSVIYSQEYTNEIYAILLAGEYKLSLYSNSDIEKDHTLNLGFSEAPSPIPSQYLTIGNNQANNTILDPINQEVNFTFGGDITAFRKILTLTENKQLTVSIDKPVIVEISQSNTVIYSEEYTTELTVTVLAGEYQLNLFTESSIEEDYVLTLNTVKFDEFEPIFNEPPNPITPTLKNLGNDFNTAFDFGTLKPWENDDNSGLTWNQGYVYPSAHLGHSSISNLVQQNKVDYCTFTLDETCYINLFHRDVMVTILDDDGIILSSNNNYTGQLQKQLEAGKYYLSLANNGNNSVYFVSIYLSNLDPNYAD
jgi:hypothetical protein